ncbi:hypothetical protein ACQBAU_13570 [Propionibacteriaceae bacterium Y2011]|uniref:hypothetical protein n=1 Tax=Microlunatus sp. Y2014 TaxID=3418488 RepID=UPI003B4B7CA5
MESIRWGDAELVDAAGAAILVRAGGPVVGWGIGPVMINSTERFVDMGAPEWEVDEVAHTATVGPLRISVRHSLDRTWAIRVAVANTSADEVYVDQLPLLITVGDRWAGWAVRAGAEASVTVLPKSEGDPTYGFSLLQGELRGDGPFAEAGGFTLQPGAQHVIRLRGESYDSPRELGHGRHEVLPEWAWFEAGEVCRLHHPDLGVVGLDDSSDETGTTELEGEPGQRFDLPLAGPRGLVDVSVRFAPTLTDLVDRQLALAERTWPTVRQGIMINSAAAGLVVQRFLGGDSTGGLSRGDWDDALDGLCARVDEASSAFAVALLARRAITTGEVELAERASAGLAALATGPAGGDDRPARGATLVLPEVLAARQLTGLDPTRHLGRPATFPATAGGGLERVLTTAEGRADAVRLLGASWGAGLRGDALAAAGLPDDAYTLAVARMLAELDPPHPAGWACSYGELLARHDRRIRYEVSAALEALSIGAALGGSTDRDAAAAADQVAEALAWLVLAPTT